MQKQIINSTMEDIDTIFNFYDMAIDFQKKVFHKQWEGFEHSLVETEIKENRQWKIIENGKVACTFVITFNDTFIWKERDKQPSIYIHRIVTNPEFRGKNYVNDIILWAKQYCKEQKRDFIRLDTWGDNHKLIDYYVQCGFTFLEIIPIDNVPEGGNSSLPKHYKGTLALFEIPVYAEGMPSGEI